MVFLFHVNNYLVFSLYHEEFVLKKWILIIVLYVILFVLVVTLMFEFVFGFLRADDVINVMNYLIVGASVEFLFFLIFFISFIITSVIFFVSSKWIGRRNKI